MIYEPSGHFSLCAAAMAMCGLVLGAAPASASIHNTPGYVHIVNAGSGKCIDATDAGAVQWRCLNTFNEEWQFVSIADGSVFEIVSHSSGECLTEADSGPDFRERHPGRAGALPARGPVRGRAVLGPTAPRPAAHTGEPVAQKMS